MGRPGGTRFGQKLREELEYAEVTVRIESVLRRVAEDLGTICAVVAVDHDGIDPDRLQDTALTVLDMADAWVEQRHQPPPPWPVPDSSEDPEEPADWREARRPNARTDREARRQRMRSDALKNLRKVIDHLPDHVAAGDTLIEAADAMGVAPKTITRTLDRLDLSYRALTPVFQENESAEDVRTLLQERAGKQRLLGPN